MSESSRTLRNVFSNWGGFALSAVVNFLLAPFVVTHLGNMLYGISVLFLALTGYLGMLDLGVRGALTRYIARFHSRSEHEQSSQATSAAVILFGGMGVLLTLVCVLLALRVDILPISASYHDLARVLFLLLGPNLTVSLISGVFSGVLMGLQRFEPVNLIGVLATLGRAIAIVAALSAGGGLLSLVWIQLLTTLLATIACAWICFRAYPEMAIGVRQWNREYAGLILSFTLYSFVLLVFDPLLAYLVSIVVGLAGSAALVTFFWIGANLIHYSRIIVGGIAKTSTPLASAFEAQGDPERLRQATLVGSGYATLVVLPVAVTFLLRGSSFIALWMGAEYGELSGKVLWILTIGLIFSASSQIGLATVLGISKHAAVLPIFVLQATATLVAGAVVMPNFGLPGVAWAITIPYLAVSLLFWPIYLRRTVGVSLAGLAVITWMRPLAAVVPFAICTYAVERFWPASHLVIFFLQVALILPVAALGAWFICLTNKDREMLSQAILLPAMRMLRLR
jgi:O-antigen/teichoic acid export membrane protein